MIYLRKARGISQRRLGRLLNISKDMIRSIESGKTTIEKDIFLNYRIGHWVEEQEKIEEVAKWIELQKEKDLWKTSSKN